MLKICFWKFLIPSKNIICAAQAKFQIKNFVINLQVDLSLEKFFVKSKIASRF